MLHVLQSTARPASDAVLRAMFAARKSVFVDLLKWDVPVLDGAYEIDQFDDVHATYLILAEPDGTHLGSARLLPTTRPHILDSFYSGLCEGAPPRDADTFEITCLRHAPTPLAASGLDMRVGHPAASMAGHSFPSEVLKPRRRLRGTVAD